jgi:hypothetical protein
MHQSYQILQGDGMAALAMQVQRLIEEGWRPLGGVCIAMRKVNNDGEFDENGTDSAIFYQGMTRGI